MTASRVLQSLLLIGLLSGSAFAFDAESEAWAAALALEQKAAVELGQVNLYAQARAAFEAFAQAYPKSVHLEQARVEAAFSAAMDLKVKSKPAEATAAFDAFAKDHPTSRHARHAVVESGVNWFIIGKSKQVFRQNTPEAIRAFDTALERFGQIAGGDAADPSTARAQFMRGSTHFLMGDLDASEKDFGVVIDKFPNDKAYYGKSLERRAAARRGLLKPELALADLQRYQRELGARGEENETVKRYLGYTLMFEKPAPPLDVESWIQGEPTTLEALRGDVVVVYCFATWCPTCAREKDHILDVVARFEPKGVKFIGVITHSQGTTVETARPFLAANRYNFPVLMDRGTTVAKYLSTKIPDVILIDRAGRVRWHDNPANLQDSILNALITEDVTAPGTTSTPVAKPR
jgi:peroxiredoxin/outer membrane protein assembly factor BamD (BamD/ComL family)